MDPVKELALKIVQNLEPDNVKNIKSFVGFMELCCDIVEEACERIKTKKFKIKSAYKKELALEITLNLLKKLKNDRLIDGGFADKLQKFISETDLNNLGNFIDDIVSIWNDIKVTTLKFLPCLNMCRKSIRKLENVKADNNSREVKFIKIDTI
jgi:hypothetical protein